MADFKWRKEVPSKVLCFTWRAMLGRIPSSAALLHRGISVSSPNCSFCGAAQECADHILVSCPLAVTVWSWVWKWCNMDHSSFTCTREILEFATKWGRCPKKRSMLEVICHGAIWSLWISRNDRIFKMRHSSASRIMDDIISLVFMWFKHRGRLRNCNWSLWCMSLFNCL